jgi:hypothetical protein
MNTNIFVQALYHMATVVFSAIVSSGQRYVRKQVNQHNIFVLVPDHMTALIKISPASKQTTRQELLSMVLLITEL